jgi:hypothetical protein
MLLFLHPLLLGVQLSGFSDQGVEVTGLRTDGIALVPIELNLGLELLLETGDFRIFSIIGSHVPDAKSAWVSSSL